MAKKKIVTKHIRKGCFYHIHEGSKTGHPGKIYWKNDQKNLYLVITTDSTDGEHRTKLQFPTDSRVSVSFVYNRPMLAKRKDIGSEHKDMSFNRKDVVALKIVSRRKYRETKSIKSKDRRYLKKLKKKPRY